MIKLVILLVFMVFLAILALQANAQPQSSMYTLDNIYYYLTEGTEAIWGSHSLEPQSGGPGQDIPGFTKSLDDIYDDLKVMFVACTAGPNDVKAGVSFFSTQSANWGPRLGVNVPSSSFGWGENSSGDPSNISFWPTRLYAYGRSGGQNATGTMAIYPVSQSSPLYSGSISYSGSYALLSISFQGTAFKLITNTQSQGFFFPSTSVTQSLSSASDLTVVEYTMGGQSATLQSVIYGSLRKLAVGTDYSEELRSSDNIQKGWTPFNYLPVPNDFGDMDAISSPYPNLHDENTATVYSKTSSSNSESHIMHKIVLNECSEDAIRIFMRNRVNQISGRSTSSNMFIWNFNTSGWITIASSNPPASALKVIDVGKNISAYMDTNIVYLLSRSRGSNNNGDVVTTYYQDFDIWAGYKNPQDI